jgi:hypothetical protein
LVRFLWCECHTLWKQRNGEVHGKESRATGQDGATQSAWTALTALCEKAPHLLEADRRFFGDETLEERLEAPTKVIRDWANTHKPAVKAGLWRASEHNRMHNRDTREHFKVIPRDQVTASSDDDDEDCCTDDMVETSDDGNSSSEDDSDDDSSSDNHSSSPTNSGEGADERTRQGFMKLAEQKITDFFRLKPRDKTERPTARPPTQQQATTPE